MQSLQGDENASSGAKTLFFIPVPEGSGPPDMFSNPALVGARGGRPSDIATRVLSEWPRMREQTKAQGLSASELTVK